MFIVTLHQMIWIFVLSEGVSLVFPGCSCMKSGWKERGSPRKNSDWYVREKKLHRKGKRKKRWLLYLQKQTKNKNMLTPWTSNLSLTWWRHSPVCIFKIFLSKRVFIIVLLIVLSSQRMIKEEWEAQQRKEQEEKEQKQKEKRDREVKRALGG